MPLYSYNAIGKHGVETAGVLEASSEDGVVALLSQRGITPISISLETEGVGRRRPGEADILFFTRNLGVALNAGVTVLEALEIMERDKTRKSMKDMVHRLDVAVRGGSSLSEAFIPFRKYFNPAFIGLLRAGESSGSLGKTFLIVSEFLRKDFSLHQRVKSALVYPLVLVLATGSVVALLVGFVLPRLTNIFAQSKVALPLITRTVLFVANVFSNVWFDLVLLALIIVIITWFRRSDRGQAVFAAFTDNFPITQPVVRGVALVQFSRTLGNMLNAGVPMLESLETVAEGVAHRQMSLAIGQARIAVEGGARLSDSLADYPDYFPSVFVGLVRVGEETGKLGGILVDVSEFYDEEVDYLLKNMMALLEPLLLLVMGVIVAVIAMAVLLPIYQLVTTVSQ
jgi:type II secretory pathway component PulF